MLEYADLSASIRGTNAIMGRFDNTFGLRWCLDEKSARRPQKED